MISRSIATSDQALEMIFDKLSDLTIMADLKNFPTLRAADKDAAKRGDAFALVAEQEAAQATDHSSALPFRFSLR